MGLRCRFYVLQGRYSYPSIVTLDRHLQGGSEILSTCLTTRTISQVPRYLSHRVSGQEILSSWLISKARKDHENGVTSNAWLIRHQTEKSSRLSMMEQLFCSKFCIQHHSELVSRSRHVPVLRSISRKTNAQRTSTDK